MRNNILVQKNSNPYYILAPSYTVQSAGVKALHLLCHHLNMKGYSAFLVNVRLYDGGRKYEIDPNLITPFLTDAICDLHIEKGLVPIVIYPDIVVGNPLNSNCVVRYLLHYAGFLGGQKNFPDNELVFCYTKKIANYANASDKNTLFMPICNTEVFYPPNDGSVRQGSCFYASKYLSHHKGKLFDITKNSVEIKKRWKSANHQRGCRSFKKI